MTKPWESSEFLSKQRLFQNLRTEFGLRNSYFLLFWTHATLLKYISSLQNLALCTASLMYILSRDRLNMDLDRSCLDLMIRLLELDQDQGGGVMVEVEVDSTPQFSAREIAKVKEKIRKLCDTVHNKHLDLQNITVQKKEPTYFKLALLVFSFVYLVTTLDHFNSMHSVSAANNVTVE